MKKSLNIAILQSDIIWEDPKQNRLNFSKKIEDFKEVDIIVLQEMFTTGFTTNVEEVFETMGGDTVNWMLKNAAKKKALIVGSIIIKEKESFFNRLIVAFPNGKLKFYDKKHLFSYAGEDEVFSSGEVRLTFSYKGFKICPMVCYDLRFPVWSRNTEEIDVLIYVANWPKPRINAWDILLKARAIENLCYVIGVNRLGQDFNKLDYLGHSTAIDPLGKTILQFNEGESGSKTTVLDKAYIEEIRNNFGFLDDADPFKIL